MRKIVPFIAVFSATLVLAGCSTPPPTPTPTNVVTPTPTPSEVWAPKYAEIVNINGQEQTLKVGEYLELATIRTQGANSWIPYSSDESIVTVQASSPNKFATPVVKGVKEGTATVTLTNDKTQEVVTFGVKVTGE